MFLKYMEIQGFKSFPDKITIELHPGITGIVGPNGSGKSNVSDAIRWVLGEQSAKSLRGGKMEDVIFSGTEERKPMGFAEVSVCFDNADRHFKLDYDEVLITRRYFRSGESEYYLNKNSCRLRDIHELMMDTGMGRDGYSMVGQGKIDEIISAKPEDRRMIFEEAAGIAKFRYRKIESERKMQQTGENLVRLLDIIGEIEGRLSPLEKESEKAKLYLKLRDELKENEINLSLHLLDDLKEKIEKTKNLLAINKKDLEEAKSAIEEFERGNVYLLDDSRKKQAALDEATARTFTIQNEISAIENKIDLLNNSKAFNFENINRIRAEIQALEENISAADTEIAETQIKKEASNAELSAITKDISELQTQITALSSTSEEAVAEIESINRAILDNMQQISELKAKISSLHTLSETSKTRMLSIEEDIAIKEEDIAIAKKRAETEEEKGKALLSDFDNLKKQLSAAEKEKSDAQDKFNAAIEEKNRLNIALQQAESRQKMLLDMEKSMEGYAHSVKTVMQAIKSGALSHVTVHGTVSSVIRTEQRYTTAIEVALGNAAQNLITRSEDDAKKAISYLKSVRGGRATFLPISAVKGRALNGSDFKGTFGYIGIAADLVSCKDEYKNIIKELLGRTLVFETMDSAIAFAKKEQYKFRLVTLEGEIFAAGGAITGGNLGKGSGFLSRKNQIDDLTGMVTELNRKQKDNEKQTEILKQDCDVLFEKVKEIETKVQNCQNELFKSNYNFEHYKTVLSAHENELSELKKEQISIKTSVGSVLSDTENATKLCAEKESEAQVLQQKLRETQEKSSKNRAETASLSSRVTKLQIDEANIQNDIRQFEELIFRLENDKAAYAEKIALKHEELSNSDSEEGSFLQKIDGYRAEIEQKQAELSALNDTISALKEEKQASEKAILDNQTALKEANERVVSLSQEQVRIENKETRRQAEYDGIINRMWEDYELTYNAALPMKKELENLPETQKLVNSLKAKIRSLGNINVSAIDEFAELKERYEFLSAQKKDMEEAKETLSKIIDDIETLMTKQFKEQLVIINDAFKRIFSHLFNGGTAELVLSDPDNILTSGVEIVAQPPGKKLQNMTLFSGGEKAIIAISLLFALLEVRPSPLCILDEIEAALDDVNVARFASYLRNISKHSQIAIITHRRGTMEEADRLYGVTMQEKGISKLLQLNIDEIEQKILKK